MMDARQTHAHKHERYEAWIADSHIRRQGLGKTEGGGVP